MSQGDQRPGSADTMLLILKPRQEDYKNVAAQLSGSENERLAYRKNRVIQMKLGSYLAEVCLQERSSALILKNEEHRFLQKVSKRTSTPRSVLMLQELHRFMHKKCPKSAVEVERTHATESKAAVNPLQETFRDQDPSPAVINPSKPSALSEILHKLPSAVGQRERHVVVANMSCVSINKIDSSGLKLELPSIKSHSKPNSSGELLQDSNSFEQKTFLNAEETPIDLPETSCPTLPNITEDSNKLGDAVDISYLTFNDQENHNLKNVFGIPFSDKSENVITSLELVEHEKVEIKLDKFKDEDFRCDEVTFQYDKVDGVDDLIKSSGKQRLSRVFKKSTLNHVKLNRTPPPLRHNITSVLRQEKTKMESRQVKIDDFPHKMPTFLTKCPLRTP